MLSLTTLAPQHKLNSDAVEPCRFAGATGDARRLFLTPLLSDLLPAQPAYTIIAMPWCSANPVIAPLRSERLRLPSAPLVRAVADTTANTTEEGL